MTLSFEQRLHLAFGALVFRATALEVELEQAKAQLAEKAADAPAQEPDAPAGV